MRWTKSRGKLGLFDPLIGTWQAEAKSEMGNVKCMREFKRVLSGKYLQLTANWEFADKSYAEQAFIGVNPEKESLFLVIYFRRETIEWEIGRCNRCSFRSNWL